MCYKCLACESKIASILNLIVGSSVGWPLTCPLFPFLKVVGCPLSCPLYPYMGPPRWRRGSGLDFGSEDPVQFPAYPHRVWALWWQGGKRRLRTSRFPIRGRLGTLKTPSCPWRGCPAAGQNLETGHLSRHYIAEISLNVTLNHNQQQQPYMAVVGSLICMAKFPWAALLTPLPTKLPTFLYLEVVGYPLSCPLFPYMDVVGSLICMAKFPWAAHSVSHVMPRLLELWTLAPWT